MTLPEPVRADADLAARTQAVYERQAARFDAERARVLYEKAWLDRFLDGVGPGGRILDLGCGTGDPLAAYMAERGFRVVGLDASRAMVEVARSRYPEGDWRQGDMRTLDLPERFDGVLGWDSFFHLTPAEQRAVLPRIAAHMAEGAALMLTVGPGAGEVVGHVGAEPVHHASLEPEEYRDLLAEHGVEVVAFVPEDPTCGHHSVLLARRGGPTASPTPPGPG
jgi:SAM-dependent methyltransferase